MCHEITLLNSNLWGAIATAQFSVSCYGNRLKIGKELGDILPHVFHVGLSRTARAMQLRRVAKRTTGKSPFSHTRCVM